MKGLFWVLALFAAAVGLTLATRYNPGYVLIAQSPYRVEISLNLFVVILVLGFVLAYGFVRLAAHTLKLPAEVRAFRLRRARDKARAAMLAGLKAFFEGRYAKAERAAAEALEAGESPAVNGAVAARAAHELRNFDKRDGYLAKLEAEAPDEKVVRLMAEADFLLDHRRFEDALKLLRQLREGDTRQHTAALRLELKAQQQAKNWDAVLELVESLKQRDAFDATLVDQMRRHAYLENLKRKALSAPGLREYWQKLPAEYREDPRIAAVAAQAFLSLGGCAEAQEAIEQSLGEQWDTELVSLYADCRGKDTTRQIERAEQWLEEHPQDAALLLVLARLCAHQGLWGKAQSYVEASLSVEPSHTAHLLLAELLEKAGRSELAHQHTRKGLDLALARLKDVTGGRRKAAL
ncbi:MAG: heme biosynthesis protein HemY [Betaproteobacteria bacterium]|nr:heme biosynthesis protein HemY [Betaproteobacteria bacterium]